MLIPELALLLWVPIAIGLFARLRPALAVTLAFVGAGLLLPVDLTFDTKGLPPMDRERLAAAAALLGALLFAPGYLRRRMPPSGAEWLIVLLVIGGFATALTNQAPTTSGGRTLPALSPWDGVSRAADVLLTFGIPFYLGRALFRTPRDLRLLLGVLVLSGLAYSLLIVWEARMSPQLHNWIYGYLPGSWRQAYRAGGLGWRPMVFVGHGLALSMFVVSTVLAAWGLWRARARPRDRLAVWAGGYLWGILVLCQSLASLVYGTAATALFLLVRIRVHVLALLALVAVTVTYPALRTAEIFPTQTLVEAAALVSEERSESLAVRFENEDKLLDRAGERPLFGWGAFGRDRIYDERGWSEVIIDGFWIIELGQNGLVGFLGAFGLLLIPVVRAARRAIRRSASRSETWLVVATAWIVVVNAVDLLPNGLFNSRPALLAGALAGALQGWEAVRGAEPRGRRSSGAAPPEEAEPPGRATAALSRGLRRRSGAAPAEPSATGRSGAAHGPRSRRGPFSDSR